MEEVLAEDLNIIWLLSVFDQNMKKLQSYK